MKGQLFRPMLVCSHVIYCNVRQSSETLIDLFYSPQSVSEKWCSLDAMVRKRISKVEQGIPVREFENNWCAKRGMIILEIKYIF